MHKEWKWKQNKNSNKNSLVNYSAPPIISPKKRPNLEDIDLTADDDSVVTNTSNLTDLMLTSNEENSTKPSGKDEVINAGIVPTLTKPTVGVGSKDI